MKKLILAFVLSLFSSISMAHPGHGLESAYAGFMHPVTGLDHLLVMLAVGMWAAKIGGRARWQLPVTFVFLMFTGAFLGASGLHLGGLETLISASVMAMGILLALHLTLSKTFQFCLTAVFALFHGLAHGVELQANSMWSALFAMVIATSLLHAIGYVIGVQRQHLLAKAQEVFAYSVLIVGAFLLVS